MRRKRIAFFPAHPSQLWLLRPVAESLADVADALWVLRDKDCMVDLAEGMGLEYRVLSRAGRGLWSNATELAANTRRCLVLSRREGIDLWISKYGSANLAAWLAGKPSLSFNDDDADIVPLVAWTSYPFAEWILTPRPVRMGRFDVKALRYSGMHELFYLHPVRFTPDPLIRTELGLGPEEPFALLRFSALHAHHDLGARGMGDDLVRRVLDVLATMRVYISSERPLSPDLEPYRLPIPPGRIHHILAAADLFAGDSQTMTSEAAVLGTPALRLSSFVGCISVIHTLEERGLAYGFRPGEEGGLLATIAELRDMPDRRERFRRRQARFLAECVDPVPWFAGVVRRLLEGRTRSEVATWARRNGAS